MAIEGVALSFTEEALGYIVQKALELKVGARGLPSICKAIMQDSIFDLPSAENIKSIKHTLKRNLKDLAWLI